MSMRGGTGNGVMMSTSMLPDCDVGDLLAVIAGAAPVIDRARNSKLSAAGGMRFADHPDSLSVGIEMKQGSAGSVARSVPLDIIARRLIESWVGIAAR